MKPGGLIAGLGIFGIAIALNLGHEAIDQLHPDKPTAQLFYGLTIFAFLAIVALSLVLKKAMDPIHLLWGLLGILLGWLLAWDLESYDNFRPIQGLVNVAAIAAGIAAFVLSLTWEEKGDQVARAIGVAAAATFFTAAVYHLMTLSRQIEMAKEAHETPFGFVILLTGLLVAGFVHNRK